MPWEWIDEGPTSDVTFRAWAADLDELFRDSADACLHAMVESPRDVAPSTTRPVELEADSLDLLLVKLVDEILFYKDAEGLFLRAPEIAITGAPGEWRLRGTLAGEPIDAHREALRADVKAATVHGLRVERTERGWEATLTLDV